MEQRLECPSCRFVLLQVWTPAETEAVCPECGTHLEFLRHFGPGIIVAGKYHIQECVRKASTGDLYRATQMDVLRDVLVKIIDARDASEEERGRFLRAVRAMSDLRHPHLLMALDAGEDGDVLYLVTDYCEGSLLAEFIDGQTPMDEPEALRIVRQVAEALSYVWWEKQILHRNIKPKTILMTERRGTLLCDFGLAISGNEEEHVTEAGYVIGSPRYMSPEQLRLSKDLDFRSDMYSLGVVLYELLAGGPMFGDEAPMVIVHKQLNDDPETIESRNPKVTKACARLVHRMLAKDREQRFSGWDELLTAIRGIGERLATGPGAVTQKTDFPTREGAPSVDSSGSAIFVVVLAVIAAVLMWLLLRGCGH